VITRLLMQFGQLCVAVFGVVTITFVIIRSSGNPLDTLLPLDATEGQRVVLSHQLGLDQSVFVQYLRYVQHGVRGDFGISIVSNVPASHLVLDQLPQSLLLAACGLAVSAVVGILGGAVAAIRRGNWPDRVLSVVATVGQAMPVYWLGLILIIVFAVQLGFFPATGIEGPKSLVLPTAALAFVLLPSILRLTRSTMIDVLQADFMRFHVAKGLPPARLYRHALKNSLPPIISLIGLQAGVLMGGLVAIEYVFGRPGIGGQLIHSTLTRDYPVVQAAALAIGLLVVLTTLISDVLVAAVDPRIRVGGRAQ
jgi:peptide/nickel transport system permease protein